MLGLPPLNIFGDLFFGDVNVFILTMLFAIGVVILWARSLAILAASLLILLLKISIETDLFIYDSLIYTIFAIGSVILALKMWNYSTGSESQ